MKKSRILMLFLAAALFALAGCGGGGSGGGVVNQDPDGDGIVTAEDAFPNDATRFAAFESDVDDTAGTVFSVLVAAAENTIVAGGQSDLGAMTLRGIRVSFDPETDVETIETLSPIPTTGNHSSAVYGVNEAGLAVGESSLVNAGTLTFVPVYWAAGSLTPTPLPMIQTEEIIIPPVEEGGEPTVDTIVTTFTNGAAYGVNASGQIAGELIRDDGSMMAVLWQPDELGVYGEPMELPGLLLGGAATAHFINGDGLIVGESMAASGMRATLWTVDALGVQQGDAIDLGTVDTHVASTAYGVDALGRIVGESETGDGIVHGALWLSAGESAQSLGGNSSAMAISAANNRIVGSALVDEEMRAAVWDTRNATLANFDTVLSSGSEGVPAFAPTAGSSRAYAMSQGEFNVVVGLFVDKAFVAVPVMP